MAEHLLLSVPLLAAPTEHIAVVPAPDVPDAEQVAVVVPAVCPALQAWCWPWLVEQLTVAAPAVAEQVFPDTPCAPVALQTTVPLEPPGAAPPDVLHPVAPVPPPAEQLAVPVTLAPAPAAEQGVLSPLLP
jgi:hypothetical protein